MLRLRAWRGSTSGGRVEAPRGEEHLVGDVSRVHDRSRRGCDGRRQIQPRHHSGEDESAVAEARPASKTAYAGKDEDHHERLKQRKRDRPQDPKRRTLIPHPKVLVGERNKEATAAPQSTEPRAKALRTSIEFERGRELETAHEFPRRPERGVLTRYSDHDDAITNAAHPHAHKFCSVDEEQFNEIAHTPTAGGKARVQPAQVRHGEQQR